MSVSHAARRESPPPGGGSFDAQPLSPYLRYFSQQTVQKSALRKVAKERNKEVALRPASCYTVRAPGRGAIRYLYAHSVNHDSA